MTSNDAGAYVPPPSPAYAPVEDRVRWDRTPPPEDPRRNRHVLWALLVAVAVIAALVVYALHDTTSTVQRTAERTADLDGVVITDDGHTIVLDGEGEESPGVAIEDTLLVLNILDTPGDILAQIQHTRALDGTRTAVWGDTRATWTYHPDEGLDLVVTDR